jgi:O-antigen biosynthesis protein
VRKDVLMKIGGFDPLYRCAGDDVDVCWRIQEAGYTIGFHPSALVWHHRRNSFKAYWKQQQGYGKAEALLEAKWPEKYNGFGHLTWAGRIYGNGFTLPINVKKGKVFHGTWGSALFQSVYQPAEGFLNCIPLMPEWYLFSGLFAALSCLGFLWPPLLAVWPVFIASIAIILLQGIISAIKNTSLEKEQQRNWKYFSLIVVLHIIQPVARLRGRIKHGLTPWRIRGAKASMKHLTFLKPKTLVHWSEGSWKANEAWLEEIEQNIIGLKARVRRGGDFDNWDIETRNGLFSTAKGVLTVEEHGANKQYLKFRYSANYSVSGLILIGLFASIAVLAASDQSWIVAGVLSIFTFAIAAKYVLDSASVVSCIVSGFKSLSSSATKESVLNIVHKETIEEEVSQTAPLPSALELEDQLEDVRSFR